MEPNAPSGPVQTFPFGLLSFLNIKNVGRYPTVLRDDYQPSLDLTQWLLETNALETVPGAYQSTIAAGPIAGFYPFNGSSGTLQVPQNEFWFVDIASILAVVQPGEGIDFALAYCTGPGPGLNYFALDRPSGAITSRGWSSARGFWLPPNAQLGALAAVGTSLGTVTIDGFVRYTPLRI